MFISEGTKCSMVRSEMKEKAPRRTDVGLVFAGGTIFATVDRQGFRTGGHARELVDFIHRDFPDIRIPLSQPSEIAFTGLSENVEFLVLDDITQAVMRLAERPTVRSIVVTHGTDTLEQTGSHLHYSLDKTLKEQGTCIYMTAANNPYPAQDARDNLSLALNNAASREHEPGVYIVFDNEVIPVEHAQKETFEGTPMRFYNTHDPKAQAREGSRRFRVFKKANELAKILGYPGMIALVGNTIMEGLGESSEKRLPIVNATPGPYKTPIRSFGANGNREEWIAAMLSHCLDPNQITPFPNYQAFFWPVNKIAGPFRIEPIIQGFFPQVKACILILNHSGTAHTDRQDLSISKAVERMREEQGITTLAVTENGEPVNFGEGSYVTSRDLRDAGVIPLPMNQKVAWVKMFCALDRGLNPSEMIDFMITSQLEGEFTGEVDETAVRVARSKYSW